MNISFTLRNARAALCVFLLFFFGACHAASDYTNRTEVKAFIDNMVKKHQFDKHELTVLFSQVQPQTNVLTLMEKPAEKKPWYLYEPLFITDAQIEGGVRFWNQNHAALTKAAKTYGVPPEIIVAIIGVETRYGGNTGKFPVLDTLTTLAFDYPKRSPFFTKELEEYLLLTREEDFDPRELRGSYAGAMGMPQFMPSSYRHYAVDFSEQGQRDLFTNIPDVIGSVANYFSEHGWQANAPIAIPATVQGTKYKSLPVNNLAVPDKTVASFQQAGVKPSRKVAPQTPATFIMLETKTAPEYWLGFKNFYVITRYNRSVLYAMAVYTLSEKIKAAR